MTTINLEILTDIMALSTNVYFYHNSNRNWAKPIFMTCGIIATILLAQDTFRAGNL